MTAKEAIAFAAALEPEGRVSLPASELRALRLLASRVTVHAQAELLRRALVQAEAFRNASRPGHVPWYEEHLRTAAALAGFKP